jgi:hypothetical protein
LKTNKFEILLRAKRYSIITVFICLALSVIHCPSPFAQTDYPSNYEIDTKFERISSEYAECTAYYKLVTQAMIAQGRERTAISYHKLENIALFYAILLANNGKAKEISVDLTNSRIAANIERISQEINSFDNNIYMVMDRYDNDCQKRMIGTSVDTLKEALKYRLEEVDMATKNSAMIDVEEEIAKSR